MFAIIDLASVRLEASALGSLPLVDLRLQATEQLVDLRLQATEQLVDLRLQATEQLQQLQTPQEDWWLGTSQLTPGLFGDRDNTSALGQHN